MRPAVRWGKKEKVFATLKVSLWLKTEPISWSKPVKDNEGRAPTPKTPQTRIGRGPDIPVRVYV